MTSFDKTWARQETQSVSGKLREAVKPQGALKPRIQTAVNKLQVQISKMDSMNTKLQERDQQIFQRVVTAMQQHDTSTSKVLSNELAEIRKVSRMLGNARMSLEQVQLRLTTIHDLGDAMVAIGPAMSTMKGLKSSLGRFMPEADTELNSMTQTLNGLMVDSFSGDAFNVESEATSEETDKILQEASAVAEQQIGDKFPSVPSLEGLSSPSTTASTASSTSSTYE
jgi:division protein CdvB (Snf7/Vps24/ESCRT-III family)